jgi:hypothetical protein
MKSHNLVTYASPWNNEENTYNKKRPSTMRKPNKPRPIIENVDLDQPDEYTTFSENFQNLQPSTIEDTQNITKDRNDRVNELLNKITSADKSNDSKMGNFNPLEPPSLNIKKDSDYIGSTQYIPPVPTFPHFNQPTTGKETTVKYTANNSSLDKYSQYGKSYDGAPYYSKMGLGGSTMQKDDKLLEKINYMIHLLEQQQNEKTDNITEEFILYTFLGVFIIFIVDSFARTGTYKR